MELNFSFVTFAGSDDHVTPAFSLNCFLFVPSAVYGAESTRTSFDFLFSSFFFFFVTIKVEKVGVGMRPLVLPTSGDKK